ncbi:MAG TPA: hypothetical protein VF580_10570 [Thermoanaerobaculia bacterium]
MIGFFLAFFVSLSHPGSAGVFWKTVPIESPLSPNVGLVLGNESRTLAFGASGVYEFDGFGWHRIRVYTDLGAETTLPGQPFFRAGRFFALDRTDRTRTRLLRLEGDTWKKLFESGPMDTFAMGATRLYFARGGFDAFCRSTVCSDPYSEGIRMISVALGDGTIREEAKSPACTGELYAAGDVLYLRARSAGCAGPSARTQLSRVGGYGDASIPLYRLDGDRWTLLPRLDESGYGLFTTEHDLWTISSVSPVDEQIRRLTPAGLSPPVLLPHSGDFYDREFTEWNGEVLYTTGFRNNLLYRLHAGAFESVAAPFFGALYAVAGSRLFAAGTGSDVHLYNGSGWSATTGIEGSREAVDAFLAGDSSLFAVRGAEVWRRDGADWTRLPRPPLVDNVPRGFVFQNRPILVNGSRLLAFDGSAWMDLGPFQADVFFTSYAPVPPTLVTPNEFWISAHVDTLLRYRDGVLTTFHNSSFASPPPGGPFENHPTTHVREMGGAIVVFGTAGDAYRLAEDRSEGQSLVPAFPELTDYWFDDGAAVDGRTFLSVRQKPETASPPATLVEVTLSGTRPLIAPHDYQRGLLAKQGEDFLTTFGGALLLGGLSLTDAGVFAQRGDQPAFSVDPSGLFATSTSFDASYAPHVRLLLPAVRVRKVIAASVDTAGVGGRRYRTTLVLANFSATRSCVAHVLPGAASSPAFDVPLAPGRQVRVEDPVPGFVGPLSVDFEGLEDDRDAFAAVRVWNAVGGGSAGATLMGRDSGSSTGWTPLLPPDARAGSRLHLAMSAATDGPGQAQHATNYATDPPSPLPVPSGTLVQVDPTASNLQKVLYVGSPGTVPTDDLLGYCVRNDPGAEDVTIVSADAPGTIPEQLVRFLPAVVSVTSAYATYRTELSLGRAAFALYLPKRATYTVTWRPAGSTAASPFPVALDEGEILHVPDAVAWLGANGAFIPSGNVEGTLTFGSDDPEGASALLVNAVVLAKPIGSPAEYGTAVPSFAEGRWARERAVVPGLLESDAFRSNLAVANPEPEGGPPVTLSVELRAADGLRLLTLPSATLRPGERRQFNRPLAPRSGDAYAVVTRVAGEGRFVAYGVVNDNATGSGSLFEMTRVE